MRSDRTLAPNDLLRDARCRKPSPSGSGRPMSTQELAEAVNEYLHQSHGIQTQLDAKYVSRLERGVHRWPRDLYREGFRAILGAEKDAHLGFYITRTSAAAGDANVHIRNGLPDDRTQSVGAPLATSGHDLGAKNIDPAKPDIVMLRLQLGGREIAVPLNRRLLLQAGIGSFVEAFALEHQVEMLHEIVSKHRQTDRLVVTSSAHLDEILAHLREQWHAQVKTDNLFGPRFALASVLNEITVVEALSSALRGEQRLEIVRLGAQYAESAAWLYEDSGDLVQARHWTSRAMEWAYESGDERMLAWTSFRRSQQAVATGEVAQVIGLAQAARRHEGQLATPTRAAIRVQEAYGHALDGHEQASQRLLDEAHTWAASDTDGDARGGHGSYCTPSYIEIQRANCWLTTGKPKKAITLYEEGLSALPTVYQRNRAAALSQLAVAYLADGQLEQAASTAHTALPVARSSGSRRILEEIKSVSKKLAPHRPLHSVAALLEDLSAEGA